jgi:hypothetical protein
MEKARIEPRQTTSGPKQVSKAQSRVRAVRRTQSHVQSPEIPLGSERLRHENQHYSGASGEADARNNHESPVVRSFAGILG